MQKIAVVGSSYFEKYVEQIKTADMFPQVELFFIPDNGAPANIDINFVLNLIEEKAIQAIVLGPFDYERLAPLISIPCYIVLPNLQDFLLLHNRVKDYKKTAVVLSPQYEIDLSSLEQCLHIKYNRFFYSQDGVKDLIRQLKADGYTGVIGNSVSLMHAEKHGMDGYYYFSRKCIEDGINNALQIIRNMERENQYVSEGRSLLESTTCGVIYTDSNMTITYVNKTAFDILHCYRDSVLQKPLTDILPSKIIERLQRSGGQESNIQLTIFDTDVIGNIFPLKIGSSFPRICFMFEKASSILESEAMIRQESKRKNFSTRYSFEDIIGTSPAIRKAIDTAKRFAMRNSTVLINAETGSGKELFAQSIHGYSQRRHYPFVAINCASIPDTLIESELFGYTANSFTGASSKGKSGLIELANHGTVFLDDIDALSPSFQSKLLRVMQEREIVRIGGSAPVSVDVRFIVATNRNLSEMVARGEFRNDLYYRINILCLRIPPLRERPEDIPLLYEHYLNFFDSELAIRIHPYLHQAFFKAFSYGYPGNVRELVSVAERITALAEPERLNEGGYLSGLVSECLDIQATKEVCPNIPLLISGSYREDVRNAEYAILTHYCSANNCTMSELAKKLGISRATLYNRLRVQGKSEIT